MKKALAAIVLGSTLLVGCKPKTFETELRNILQNEYKMTPEEAEVGVVGGLRPKYGKQVKKDEKEVWEPNYDSVTIKQRIKQHEEMANDLEQLLSFRNKENTHFIDEFQIRGKLEKDEKAIQFNLNKLRLVGLYKEFSTLMGIPEDEAKKIGEIELIYPLSPLESQLQFDAKYVREAKKANCLTIIDEWNLAYAFSLEIPNPAYPEIDKTKRTIWAKKQVALRIVSYDTELQGDHQADYMEIYRGNEKKPAIKIFRSASAPVLDVAVIDYDAAGERGHGIPDEVVNVSDIQRPIDVYNAKKELLEKLFHEKKKLERIRPHEKEMIVSIVRVGENRESQRIGEVLNAEHNLKDGFSVPFEYLSRDGKNYTLAYNLKGKADEEEHEIKWVAKRYMVPGTAIDVAGRVVAYYRVKPEYREHVINLGVDGRRMTISRAGQVDVSGFDAIFVESEPYRITYDYGTSRWAIEDKDNKLPKYEIRYEYAQPHDHELESPEK